MTRTPIFDQLVAELGVTPRWRPSPHPRNRQEDTVAISQNGFVANDRGLIARHAVAAGTRIGFPGGVRDDAAGMLLMEIAGRIHREVEPLREGWCWGYAERRIRGGRALSNHASGTAIDVNAPDHPLGVRGTFTDAQVAAIRRILAPVDTVIRWGGDYSSRADEMHFEIRDGRSLADCERALAALRGAPPGSAPGSGGDDGQRLLIYREGRPMMRGADIERLQAVLNAWYPWLHLAEDGIYGPATESAVEELQQRAGIAVDGVVGPVTRGVLGL